MKIVVIGGTGLIGSKVVSKLTAHGHEAVAASPNTGVNTITGEGLADALAGASVVVDVSNSPSFADDDVMNFFVTSTNNLVAASTAAGVTHYVALTIVGSDHAPDSGYLRAKVAQEKLVRDSGLPYTLIHATQFFEFARGIADSATVDGVVTLPVGLVQPIAAEDVATAVARAAAGSPVVGDVEIAGPEPLPLADFVATALAAFGDPRTVVGSADARYFNTLLTGGELIPAPGEGTIYETSLADWLAQQ